MTFVQMTFLQLYFVKVMVKDDKGSMLTLSQGHRQTWIGQHSCLPPIVASGNPHHGFAN